MRYRERFLETLRGNPVDRPPFIETAQFNHVATASDFEQHLPHDVDPLRFFGFDNVHAPLGYEPAPVDWYAIPRFEEHELPPDGDVKQRIDGRYGRTVRILPATEDRPVRVRVFQDHVLRTEHDWDAIRERFRISTDGRFPSNWDAWCAHSETASHPIALVAMDPAAVISNLMGFEEPTGLVMSLHDRPDFVRELNDHLSDLARLCMEKALREASIDMLFVGSDLTVMLGPNIIRDFFLDAYATIIETATSCGVELICFQSRGDMRPLVPLFRDIGAGGVKYVMETGPQDCFPDLLDICGDDVFILGAVDGRVLVEDFAAIEHEVEAKVSLAKTRRIVPCLHATHVLPEVRFENYAHYVENLRRAVVGDDASDPE